MTENSFKAYDYEQAQKSYRIWQAEESKEIEDYLIRQRKSDLNNLVRKVIENELDDRDRMIVYLSWYKNMPKEQIASMLGVNRSSIFRRLEKITDIIYEKLKYAIEYRYGSMTLTSPPVLIKSCVFVKSPESMKTIGERLRQLRKSQYLSIEEVAESTGMNTRRLSEYESGTREPSATELKKLALFYKVQTDYIIFGSRRIIRDPLTGLPIDHNCEK